MAELPRKVEINLAAIRVAGFGGLCMVIASLACAAALPQTRWFMLAGISAGVLFGVVRIVLRRSDGCGANDGRGPLQIIERATPRRDPPAPAKIDGPRFAHA